ncbi:MAG: T9SS type A sorting domain-containing protein [bacterium]
MLKVLTIAVFLAASATRVSTQTLEGMAKEVWSEPQIILPTGKAVNPAITSTGDTLYCLGMNGLSRSVKVSGVWLMPQALPAWVNSSLARYPAITPDERRLYFIDYGGYGGWDLWMTEWSDSLKDWTEVINLGPTINTSKDEWCAFAPDNKTLIFVRDVFTSQILLSRWNDSTKSWSAPISLDQERVSRGWGVSGITMPGNKKKLYVGRYTQVNGFFEWELMVSYKDSATGRFTMPLRLNINSHPPDTTPTYNPENRGYDAFPSVTPDGKWMFFETDRSPDSINTNYHDIYVSRLLLDENGDTVMTSVYDDLVQKLIGTRLVGNYPNPLNPSTTIVFEVNRQEPVKITLYDITGRMIRVLVDSVYGPGRCRVPVNLGNLPSGTYFYQIEVKNSQAQCRKLILIH